MATEHKKVGSAFPEFQEKLHQDGFMRVRFGIFTTDYRRIEFDGKPFIDWNTLDPASLFITGIQSLESIQCGDARENLGTDGTLLNKRVQKGLGVSCPSGRESGVNAMKRAIQSSPWFFEPSETGEVPSRVFILASDEDEDTVYQQYRGKKPSERREVINQALIDVESEINQLLKGVRWNVYSIVVRPGDAHCLNQQNSQGNETTLGREAHFYTKLSQRTGGRVISICESSYSSALRNIGRDIAKRTNTAAIACSNPNITVFKTSKEGAGEVDLLHEKPYQINNRVIEVDERFLGIGYTVDLKYTCPELL